MKNTEKINLKPIGLFADRETIQEAIDYAEMMSAHSESPMHAITPVFVLFNTIANNYYLVPKEKEENND